PRLVISDLRLPDGDGLDVIRAAGGFAAAPAVIAITAFASRAARQSALDAGARAFLAKPFDIDELSSLSDLWIQQPAVSTPTGDWCYTSGAGCHLSPAPPVAG